MELLNTIAEGTLGLIFVSWGGVWVIQRGSWLYYKIRGIA